ncbi:MAG TPA: hypothetical protein VNO84_11640 [Burkholderiaceae bacterium]|nr:hypothetical protein [Burkholderiaceae bacterium]
MIDLRRAKLSCTPMGARLYFGGDSESSSSTKNTDARVVGGDNSSNASTVLDVSGRNASATVNISSTDHGAVAGALHVVKAGIDQAYQLNREAQAATGGLMTGALRMVGEQQQQFTQALENIKTNDVRVLVGVGVAVVGLAAVTLFKKG